MSEERLGILGGRRWADVSFDATVWSQELQFLPNAACWVFLPVSTTFIGGL